VRARHDHEAFVGGADDWQLDVPVVVNAPSPEIARYARMKVTKALRHCPRTVIAAKVRITKHHDCAVARPVIAQANIHLSGHHIRVQVAGTAALQAIDLLEARLRRRVETTLRRRALHGAHRQVSGDNERPDRYGRPAEECRVLRRKALMLRRRSVDQAVQDMISLDYGFNLFIEAGSGQDSVVFRDSDARLHVAQVQPDPDHIAPGVTPYEISQTPAPALTLGQAKERLELSGEPFVFFRPSGAQPSLRGHVLYRRYDGHYGVIGW
jgi:ribosome-associated translation inhibitor RaiA